jgi:hypothetical protein
VDPSRALATAVLKQVMHDIERVGDVGAEALAWLRDIKSIEMWTTMLDLDAQHFQEQVLERQGKD